MNDENGTNGYIYYINRNHVIDAKPVVKQFGRYANDTNGFKKSRLLKNNARYAIEDFHVYIEAIEDIEAGSEILVRYGKEYWEVMRYNLKLQRRQENNNN